MDRFKLKWYLFSSLLILSGLLIFYYFGQTLKINCFYYFNEVEAACTAQTYWFNLWPLEGVQEFSPVSYASVDSGCDTRVGSDPDICYSMVVLHNDSRTLILDRRFFNNPTARETKEKINQFLQQPAVSPLELYPTPLSNVVLSSCVGIPFLLLGLLFLWGQWSSNDWK